MNKVEYTYICFYASKQVELKAETSYDAQLKAVAHFKPPRSKQHLVHVLLAKRDGKPITHTPDF